MQLRKLNLLLVLGLITSFYAGCFAGSFDTYDRYPMDCYISTGDNHWLGQSLAIDSEKSIDDAFDMFKNALNIRRIYWRGLEEATWAYTTHARDENFRYYSMHEWFRHLIVGLDLEKVAADTAHKYGMELWGVGSIGDWGSPADVHCFNDFPFNNESMIRLEHPEWIPTDKYGYRKQGGTIELAYRQARKALIDLQVKIATQAGYDGVLFISYVENFSSRYQDEFGYSEPIVKEFKKRYGIDIRTEPFKKSASRSDWIKLRGEYMTAFLKEMKAELAKHNIKLGMFINPRYSHRPGNWATLPQSFFTLGNIYFDLETWAEEGIVDEFCVYGNSHRATQAKTVKDCLWLTRGIDSTVSFVTSGLDDKNWTQFYKKGLRPVFVAGEDQDYLTRTFYPKQKEHVLRDGNIYQKMGYLSQVIDKGAAAKTEEMIPLAQSDNVVLQRLALLALGKSKDAAAIPVIEAALFDPENGVRCKAVQALRYNNGPNTAKKLVETVNKFGVHPLCEMARDTFRVLVDRSKANRDYLTQQAMHHPNHLVRAHIIRGFWRAHPKASDIPMLKYVLDNDLHSYPRFAATMALGEIRNNPEVVNILIEATKDNDVTVANRAAASIERIVKDNKEKIRPLRDEMLKASKELFTKMGDGNMRQDYEWGYQPAGNALLAFGEEGEKILRESKDQIKDKRLAELAWRVLYFKQKKDGNVFGANQFLFITEKEDRQAYSDLPKWMQGQYPVPTTDIYGPRRRWRDRADAHKDKMSYYKMTAEMPNYRMANFGKEYEPQPVVAQK